MRYHITEQKTPSTKFTELHSGILKSATSDFGRDSSHRVVSDSLNPGQSRHAFIRAPVSIDTESLDLRTSATFARSLQSQATYSSIHYSKLFNPNPFDLFHWCTVLPMFAALICEKVQAFRVNKGYLKK